MGGLVEEVKLRTIVLRDESGSIHVIPNGTINTVKNMTQLYSYYVFNIGVAYRENVDEVMALLKDIAEELRQDTEFAADILEPLEMSGVDRFADSAVIIKCRIKTKPIQQWRMVREISVESRTPSMPRGSRCRFLTKRFMGSAQRWNATATLCGERVVQSINGAHCAADGLDDPLAT